MFERLSQQSLECLQQMCEELERTLELQHQIDKGQSVSLKDYWRGTAREKNNLRYEAEKQQWRGETIY